MIKITHTPTRYDQNNFLINSDDIEELITNCVALIRPQSKEFYSKNLRDDLTAKRESIIDRHAGNGNFYTVILGPYVTLTPDSIQKALNSSPFHCDGGNYFFLDPELLTLIEAATKQDYVIRISHTQAQWNEIGLKKLQNRSFRFVPTTPDVPKNP